MTTENKNCWECKYQQIGGDTFLGICKYFESVGKENKEIPPTVVDKGCKQWKTKQ